VNSTPTTQLFTIQLASMDHTQEQPEAQINLQHDLGIAPHTGHTENVPDLNQGDQVPAVLRQFGEEQAALQQEVQRLRDEISRP